MTEAATGPIHDPMITRPHDEFVEDWLQLGIKDFMQYLSADIEELGGAWGTVDRLKLAAIDPEHVRNLCDQENEFDGIELG